VKAATKLKLRSFLLTGNRGCGMADDTRTTQGKRDAAARARRLAHGLTEGDVRQRLLALALQMDAEADDLERRPVVTIPASEPALRAEPLIAPDLTAIPPGSDTKPKR
jgi:hypothetical protein